jgi:hypothetical protein
MSEFHDPELRQQLGRLSGPYPDDNAAFAAWQRRVGQAHRRRAMAWTTGAAMSLVFGVVGAAALQGQVKHSTAPQKSLETSSIVSTTIADTRAKPVTTDSTTPPVMPAIVAPTQITTPTSEATSETAVVAPDATDTSGTTPPATTHKGQGGTSGSQGTPTAPTQAPPPTTDGHDSQSVTQKVTSIGGTITIRQDRDQLTVIDISPAAGFQGHQSGSPGHGVAVTFTSATHRSDISVFVYHGKLVPKVTEKTVTHEGSVPTTDHSGGSGDNGA